MINELAVVTRIGAVGLFCDIGGLSHGLRETELQISAGYDLDQTCAFVYERDNNTQFTYKGIRLVSGKEVSTLLAETDIKILAGRAPCQPFSSYAFKSEKRGPNKYDLLYEFGRLVKEVQPNLVTMENVSQILTFKEKPVLEGSVSLLKDKGYFVYMNKILCPDYGIPQSRKRLVLLASKFDEISLIPLTHKPSNYLTVKDAIGGLPALRVGEAGRYDPLHRSKSLSPLSLKRIQRTPYGDGWQDWPKDLRPECHKRENGKSFDSVYGRMVWEKPAPTMATLCTGYGNGRFGHPTRDRAISTREATLLQAFPKPYQFFSDKKDVSITKASGYIGNAAPPKLGEVIDNSIIKHLFHSKNAV